MAGTEQTMKEVIDRLRRENSSAIEEARELTVAITEILRAQERLASGLGELAGEASALAALHEGSAVPRLKNLAAYAARLSDALGMHVVAFGELRKGLDGWKVEGTPS
jgi:hypothetical protein